MLKNVEMRGWLHMNYRELRKIYYSHRDQYEEEYQLRLQDTAPLGHLFILI